MNKARVQNWKPDFLRASPLFEPILKVGHPLEIRENWPDLDDLNYLLENNVQQVKTSSGNPVKFVSQMPSLGAFTRQYEPRIYLDGEIQTRTQNWHDLFNAMVWLTFPRAKATLNQLHYQALLQEQQTMVAQRGPRRDAATLFDESGVVVVSSHGQLTQLLKDFEWKTLFWAQRVKLQSHMRFLVFGHGLYEKGLNPYLGMTGRGIILSVKHDFFKQPLLEQLIIVDTWLAEFIGQRLTVSADLTPVPVLGYPGWSLDNEDSCYYDNRNYFRARSKAVN